MAAQRNRSQVYRLDAGDWQDVLVLALLRVVTLGLFLLVLITTIDLVTDRTRDIAATLAPALEHVALLVLLGVATGLIRGLEFRVCESIGYRITRDLRMRLYAHMQGMLPTQIQHRSRGGLLLRFLGDLSMLRTWISRGLIAGSVALIDVVGGAGLIAWFNPHLALAVLGVLVAGMAASGLFGGALRRATRSMRRRRSVLASNIDEQVSMMSVVQVFGHQRGEYGRLLWQNSLLATALCRVATLRGVLRGIGSGSGMLAIAAVLAAGIVELHAGRASIGLVLATLAVTRILSAPLRALALAHDYWQRSRVSLAKLGDFLASSSTSRGDGAVHRLRVRKGRIELRDVALAGRLRGVNAVLEPGQLVALTGPSGAGKSSLLAVLARQLDPDGGSVWIDAQNVADTDRSSHARSIGVMSNDLPLLRGSLRRNLTYRQPHASPDELKRVLLQTGVDRVVAAHPDGLATWLTEGGRNLSLGERQRVALARALLGNPPILLLDEPTANLDPASTAAIRDVILRFRGSVVLITHDPDELALADRVWVMNDGMLTENEPGEVFDDRRWRAAQSARAGMSARVHAALEVPGP